MNKENHNKNYFKETFEEMHAPEGLRRKVIKMSEYKEKKNGMSVVKKLAVAAALAAVVFAGSNGVAYAMTGSTWVESMLARVRINGEWQNVEMEGEILEDGTVQYSTTLEVEEDDEVEIVVDSEAEGAEQYAITVENSAAFDNAGIVVDEDGKVYLADGEVKLEITEDMLDGTASGSYEKNGIVYQYEVTEEPGVPGCYELQLTSEE